MIEAVAGCDTELKIQYWRPINSLILRNMTVGLQKNVQVLDPVRAQLMHSRCRHSKNRTGNPEKDDTAGSSC